MTNTLTSTTVPITEFPLTEVQTQTEFEEALTRIIQDEIPGFVIRSAGLTDIEVFGHEGISEAVVEALNRIDPQENTTRPYSLDPVLRAIQVAGLSYDNGVGRLHHDGYLKGADSMIDIHTTTEGSGKVTLAESGPNHSRDSKDAELDAPLAKHLANGATDPLLMSPETHTAELNAGDTVVMPLVNKQGPIVHRFDKSSDTRRAVATLVHPR